MPLYKCSLTHNIREVSELLLPAPFSQREGFRFTPFRSTLSHGSGGCTLGVFQWVQAPILAADTRRVIHYVATVTICVYFQVVKFKYSTNCNKTTHSGELWIPSRIQSSSRMLFDRFVLNHLIAVRHSRSIALKYRIERASA